MAKGNANRSNLNWTSKEDRELASAMATHGKHWQNVAKEFGGSRTGTACHQRWIRLEAKKQQADRASPRASTQQASQKSFYADESSSDDKPLARNTPSFSPELGTHASSSEKPFQPSHPSNVSHARQRNSPSLSRSPSPLFPLPPSSRKLKKSADPSPASLRRVRSASVATVSKGKRVKRVVEVDEREHEEEDEEENDDAGRARREQELKYKIAEVAQAAMEVMKKLA